MDETVAIVAAAGCLASGEDLWRRRISNWIPAAACLSALAVRSLREGWAGAAGAVAGAAAGFAVFLVFYLLGGLGGGDVKLMAGFGAALGPQAVLAAAVLAAVLGAIQAAAVLLFRPRRTIPYAPCLSLGALLAALGKGGLS